MAEQGRLSPRAEAALWAMGRGLFLAFAVFWQIFLIAPIVIVIVVSFTSANYLLFPPPGLSLQWYVEVFGLSWFWEALVSSLVIAFSSTTVSVLVGIAVARALARHRFPGRALVEYAVLSPLILPGVVLGFALFSLLVHFRLEQLGLPNLIAAHVLITLPFVVRSVWSAMAGADISLEEAAYSLGATPWAAFWAVILPMARPGISAGAILAFTYSFNDITISIFLTGAEATTLPVEVMSHIEYSADPTPAAVSSLMIALTLIFFVAIARTAGLDAFTER
jgi:putative spermidine/putrescine transport system permease protein